MVFCEALHDADCTNSIFDLSKPALEFLYVLLHIAENGGSAFAGHPRVIYDVFSFNTLIFLNCQQLSHQISCLLTHFPPVVLIKLDTLRQDFLFQLDLVVRLKGWIATQKYVEHDSDGPPINLFIVFEA